MKSVISTPNVSIDFTDENTERSQCLNRDGESRYFFCNNNEFFDDKIFSDRQTTVLSEFEVNRDKKLYIFINRTLLVYLSLFCTA